MIHGKAAQRLCLLKRAGVECIHIVRIFVSRVFSLLDYAFQVRHICLIVLDYDKLEGIQKRAMTIAFPELSYECAVNRASINTIHTRRKELYRRSYRGILSPTHKLHHLLLPHVCCLIISGTKLTSQHSEQELRDNWSGDNNWMKLTLFLTVYIAIMYNL